MIRNLIDGQDVPMIEVDGRLVIDVRQQRLEHQKCPDCPTTLHGGHGPRGWFICRCCQRAWRRRKDGYFDEQVPLDFGG